VRRVAALEECCARFGIPLAAAALQFVSNHPAVTALVVGTGNPARILETAGLARHPIPASFWSALRAEGLIDQGGQTLLA
jgi:D-threo-aldose 1-dehydrogenase